jgi:hypothetical protein
VYERIEALCDGPYVELFARQRWPGWVAWGDQADHFPVYDAADDLAKSIQLGFQFIRERVAAGGPSWPRGPEGASLSDATQPRNDPTDATLRAFALRAGSAVTS